jgi:hypothetical protein
MVMAAAIIMTVEIAGLAAFSSFRKLLLLIRIFIAPYPSFTNDGIILAATIEISTRMAACLNPAPTDSSLIFPATIPIR